MKAKKLFKLSKIELIIRQIFHVHNLENPHDQTIWNPYNLTIHKKGPNLFVSANEINKLLEKTNYGIQNLVSISGFAEPLFDKHKEMYDVLIYIGEFNSQICLVKLENRMDYLIVDSKAYGQF